MDFNSNMTCHIQTPFTHLTIFFCTFMQTTKTINKRPSYLPKDSDNAMFISYKLFSWLGSSPFWEVSLVLAPLTLHWLRNESASSVFCYIHIIFSRSDICHITIVVLSHIQWIFFHLSAKIVIFDMPWIMNGEYITYTF